MKVLSLFDGISCGRVALERNNTNVEIYKAFEVDNEAIKVSNMNYPGIEHCGDVFEGDYKQYKGYDLLLGGSPCTYWSIARVTGRETESSGLGWELFSQYVRALQESECKYFIYENNFSISKDIKAEITKALGVEPIMINSNLVSAQNRKRMYWTNIPNVTQPLDKGILLKDIVKEEREWKELGKWVYSKWGDNIKLDTLKRLVDCEKSNTLTTNKTHPRNYYLNEDKTMYTNLDSEEWELLQTLPIGYTKCISESKRHKAIGNGWTVDVIAHILSFIK